ncbi:hypothetical protein T11_2856 [Trichinella zimbabwensis]|uniref:Uncharacterized protein n=1 Tax=Trichinella zimbabwensis TaxID=268475 RepID=A0A0V1HKZ8_9BILA|nr:hypothetical protein T11_2856 [Trichinella zimbabwensis]
MDSWNADKSDRILSSGFSNSSYLSLVMTVSLSLPNIISNSAIVNSAVRDRYCDSCGQRAPSSSIH